MYVGGGGGGVGGGGVQGGGGWGEYAVSQTSLLYMKRLIKVSLRFLFFCVLCFQKQPFRCLFYANMGVIPFCFCC